MNEYEWHLKPIKYCCRDCDVRVNFQPHVSKNRHPRFPWVDWVLKLWFPVSRGA